MTNLIEVEIDTCLLAIETYDKMYEHYEQKVQDVIKQIKEDGRGQTIGFFSNKRFLSDHEILCKKLNIPKKYWSEYYTHENKEKFNLHLYERLHSKGYVDRYCLDMVFFSKWEKIRKGYYLSSLNNRKSLGYNTIKLDPESDDFIREWSGTAYFQKSSINKP